MAFARGCGSQDFFLKDAYADEVEVRVSRTTADRPSRGNVVRVTGSFVEPSRGRYVLHAQSVTRPGGFGGATGTGGPTWVLIFFAASGALLIIAAVFLLRRPVPEVRPVTPSPSFGEEYTPPSSTPATPSLEMLQTRKIERGAVSMDEPMEGTLKVLPGKWTVSDGNESWMFRLYQTEAAPEFTIGRESGPKLKHIKIASQAVSRKQAKIRYEGGSYTLVNLSSTNPSMINENSLGEGESASIENGAKIVLGDVEIVFSKT